MKAKPIEQLGSTDMRAGLLFRLLAAFDRGLERVAEEGIGFGMITTVLLTDRFDGFLKSCVLD
jgi:hypothetical protein